jgi:hypothetical protein
VAHPGQRALVKGHGNVAGQSAAKDRSLIEASLAPSFGRERNGNDEIEFLSCPAGEKCRCHQRSQKPGKIPAPAKLEALHDAA